ncbi:MULTISPECIES: transporter [Sphingobium]|uniref:transporter n=1 Tax=Sphingobium TaxID=165695 RepID=UPI002432B251|nr:transporter [Sphingobium yanoikuyae]
MGPGLIWGLDFAPDAIRPVDHCDGGATGGFRWLHLNLADHGTRQWIEGAAMLPEAVRELILSPDTHQRALVDGDTVGCVLHDFERDFDVADTARVGALRMALTPTLMLTTRLHPLRCADIARHRLERTKGVIGGAQALGLLVGAIAENIADISRTLSADIQRAEDAFLEGHHPPQPRDLVGIRRRLAQLRGAQALDLLVGAIAENIADISRTLSADIQRAEDAFLEGHHPPQPRDLVGIRRRLAQLHRLLAGARGVFQRLERDEELPDALLPTVEKLTQRLQALDADILEGQAQLRLLRDELDIQAAQRTNQNLYILSIITALMLPATLVTGLFGMNTGGMPFAGASHGTLTATLVAAGAAGVSYFLLRWMGFMRR